MSRPGVSPITNRLIQVATVAALGAGVCACGSVGAGSSPVASPSARAGLPRANVADGTLVQVKGSTLVLSTLSGDVSVTFTTATPIRSISTGTYADIAAGGCITAIGSRDATGAFTAASVTISSPVNGSCTARAFAAGSPGAFPSGRPNSTFRPRATPSGVPTSVARVRGTVTAVNVTAVTVQSANGTTQTITVPTTVKVSTTSVGSPSDLIQGACVAALGPRAASGAVRARSLVIEPAGPSGCFTRGTGTGAGSGFGARHGGGGGGTTTTA